MPSCLGLYIGQNIIKYAKITKNRDDINVDVYGVKFCENDEEMENVLNQIVTETDSSKIPISINLLEEKYNYFHVFSLLNKADMPKAIDTEFEAICYEKKYNKNALETRYILVNDPKEEEKLKVIHVAANKVEISKRLQQLDGYKITSINALPLTIPNIVNIEERTNSIIINIEERMTTITTITDSSINKVNISEHGIGEAIEKIKLRENSYSKAYNIFKNMTLITADVSSSSMYMDDGSNSYLDDIMPTLYSIASDVRKVLNNNEERIDKIYITGIASIINNIELYFEQYLDGISCELLKPYFINSVGTNINIKDYIETGEAISLGAQGLGVGVEGMNFKKASFKESLDNILHMEVSTAKKINKPNKTSNKSKNAGKINIKNNIGEELDGQEKGLLRVALCFLTLTIIYIAFSIILYNQMIGKQNEITDLENYANEQMEKVASDNEKISSKANGYQEKIDRINSMNEAITERYKTKNAIPTLLSGIMYIMPQNAQLVSIENVNTNHIIIKIQSDKYGPLGYFAAELRNRGILTNITSDQGIRENDMIKVTIEGDLL